MYDLLSLLTGLIIAVMVVLNGRLSQVYGIFTATVIVHVVGVIFAFLLCKATKKRITTEKNPPLRLYLGGAIGVLTTAFNIFAYGKISLTSIVALGLFGQAVTSLLIDCLGLFGMKKRPFRKSAVWGLVFSFFGILVMLDHSVSTAMYAVLFSFCAGITVVLSRTVNARLSHYTGELQSSLINHVVGLPIAAIFAFSLEKNNILSIAHPFSPDLWIYLGGVLGVSTVLLGNITVPRVPAFRLTLLAFVGQVFAGIAIDGFTRGEFAETTFTGGVLVAAGIALNLIYEQILRDRENRNQKYLKRVHDIEADHQNHLLDLANEPFAPPPDVVIETRPENGICCPNCWTIQPSNRNCCRGYKCKAKFIFLDELNKTEHSCVSASEGTILPAVNGKPNP